MMQKEYIGPGAINQLADILKELSPERIFLVAGKNSYAQSGAEKHLQKILADYQVTVFNDFASLPKIEDVKRGLEVFKESNPNLVIAVGGGCAIDIAKMINFFAVNNIDNLESIKVDDPSIEKPKTLIAIPTTAGSGSEATHFAVLYVGYQKHSIAHPFILPQVAVIDSKLTMSLPKKITATSGLDALCQAVESYWSVKSSDESKAIAKQAIELVLVNLSKTVNSPRQESRQAMMEAAHLAGKAINITKTTAPHAISYPLTSRFNVPHGQAVALTLPSLLVYNYGVQDGDVLDKRGSEYVRNTLQEITSLFGVETVEEVKEKIEALMKEVGLETRLEKLGIFKKDIKTIIEEAFSPDRVKNNPRKLDSSALETILENIY